MIVIYSTYFSGCLPACWQMMMLAEAVMRRCVGPAPSPLPATLDEGLLQDASIKHMLPLKGETGWRSNIIK
jgi:hypothetical protein